MERKALPFNLWGSSILITLVLLAQFTPLILVQSVYATPGFIADVTKKILDKASGAVKWVSGAIRYVASKPPVVVRTVAVAYIGYLSNPLGATIFITKIILQATGVIKGNLEVYGPLGIIAKTIVMLLSDWQYDVPITSPSQEGNWTFVFDLWAEESVGGIVSPVDKFGLLAPYIGLASTTMIGAVATAIYVKRVNHRKEKQ